MVEFSSTFDFSDSGHNLSTDTQGNIVVNTSDGSYAISGSSLFNISPDTSGFHYYSVRSPVAYSSNFQGPAGQVVHVREDFSEVYDVGLATLEQAFNATRIYPAPLDKSLSLNPFDPVTGSATGIPVQTGSLTNVLTMDADFVGFGQGGFDVFPSNGPVTHIVDESSMLIVNITMEGHALHPGLIVRHVYEDENGVIWAETLGTGVGPMAAINVGFADGVWTNVPDQSIREAILSGNVPTELFGTSGSIPASEVFTFIEQFQNSSEQQRAELLTQYFLDNPDLFVGGDTIEALFDLLDTETARTVLENLDKSCFLAGTMITLPDGSLKPIEDIAAGDVVLSYDGEGKLVPGRVTRTFQNRVAHVLDVFGLMVTPGHSTLCGEGRFAGKHVPIIDILRSDGALVREDGTLVRANSGCDVGSEGDRMIHLAVPRHDDQGNTTWTTAEVRLGARFLLDDGTDIAIMDVLADANVAVTEDGLVIDAATGDAVPLHLPFVQELPKPEDYILARSGVTLAEIYRADEWGEQRPSMPAPVPPLPGEKVTEHPTSQPNPQLLS